MATSAMQPGGFRDRLSGAAEGYSVLREGKHPYAVSSASTDCWLVH